MSLQDVVTLNIVRSAATVSRPGFGVALILGSTISTAWGSDRVRTYTKAADMLSDGFASSDPEYKRALALTSQDVKPAKFKVGRRLTAVAQVNTLTPDVSSQIVQHYKVTIDGVLYDFTSDARRPPPSSRDGLEQPDQRRRGLRHDGERHDDARPHRQARPASATPSPSRATSLTSRRRRTSASRPTSRISRRSTTTGMRST
jgi:hypothetical protein